MVRQAHNYLAGAVSGTALIGAAVVAFVMLVSFQALRDWPLAGFGGGDDSSGAVVSPGRPATAGPTAGARGVVTPTEGSAQPAGAGGGGHAHGGVGAGADPGAPTTGSPVVESPDSTTSPVTAPSTGGGSTSDSSGPTERAIPGGGQGGGGSPGSGAEGGSAPKASEAITGAVDNTVNGVDEATGGALGGTGLTSTTEEVVEGVAGPESIVGGTVDQTVEKAQEAAEGVLGGNR